MVCEYECINIQASYWTENVLKPSVLQISVVLSKVDILHLVQERCIKVAGMPIYRG